MEHKHNAYPIQDRWSYLWLGIGTLLSFFWVVPLLNWLSPIFLIRFMRTQKVWRAFLLAWLVSFVFLGGDITSDAADGAARLHHHHPDFIPDQYGFAFAG